MWVQVRLHKLLTSTLNRDMVSITLILLPLALQSTVGFGLLNNILPFLSIHHQLSPSSHSQHLKISFYFLFPSFPGSSLHLIPSSSWVKIFLGILSSSILSRWPNQCILCPFIHFTIFSPLLILSASHNSCFIPRKKEPQKLTEQKAW